MAAVERQLINWKKKGSLMSAELKKPIFGELHDCINLLFGSFEVLDGERINSDTFHIKVQTQFEYLYIM
jgi:hypothetical protein